MKIRATLLINFILLSSLLFAQNRLDRADSYFEDFDFLKAISTYEKVVKKDSSNTYAMHKIGVAYRMMGKEEKANEWFGRVVALEPNNLEDRYYYGLTMISKGEYQSAMDQFVIYYSIDTTNRLVNDYIRMPDFYTVLTQDSAKYRLSNLSINSESSDYGPTLFKNNLLFTSSRDIDSPIKRKTSWTNDGFLDLYQVEMFTDGTLGEPTILDEPITTKFHEGSATYDAMTDQLFFTRTGYFEQELSINDDGITNIEIFTSKYDEIENKWLEVKTFPYNNDDYSIAQPSISADGKTLYFVSDMPGGLGGSDIYYCIWNGVMWSEPVNLGKTINTRGNEKNPYIDKDGILFFASNGYVGLGGLDIYYAEATAKGFNKPVNMGYPTNTRFDDFSFTYTDDTKTSYFIASNREGGIGDDDIYMIEIIPDEPILLVGTVVIKESLQDAPVKMLITDHSGKLIAADTLSKSRPFELPIMEKEKSWNMVFYPLFDMEAISSKQGIDPSTAVNGILDIGEIVLGEDLPADEPEVEGALVIADEGQDPTKDDGQGEVEYIDLPSLEEGVNVQFDNIMYGFDKSNLTEKAQRQLDELIKLMKADPTTTVNLSGHTDARGAKSYNLKLSEKRTVSALNYLIENGIDVERVSTENHGELNLINQCGDGVDCTNEEHAKNRRVEIKVSKTNNS